MINNLLSGISRRAFIQISSAAAAIAALPMSRGLRAEPTAVQPATAVADKTGVWKPAACWHNCGGRCLNKALVVDGVVERQKTDDTHSDTPDNPQQRGCLRGRSQRKQVFGADRIRYPMKRKNWAPGGGDKSLRGRDQWVRISWDEALDIVASETKRIKEKYGNESIWLTGSNGTHYLNVYANYGGYTSDWGRHPGVHGKTHRNISAFMMGGFVLAPTIAWIYANLSLSSCGEPTRPGVARAARPITICKRKRRERALSVLTRATMQPVSCSMPIGCRLILAQTMRLH